MDTWQKFDLHLTVFHPILDENELLRLQGSAHGLGNWDHGRFEQNMSTRSSFDLLKADMNSEPEAKAYHDDRSIKLVQSDKNIDWI